LSHSGFEKEVAVVRILQARCEDLSPSAPCAKKIGEMLGPGLRWGYTLANTGAVVWGPLHRSNDEGNINYKRAGKKEQGYAFDGGRDRRTVESVCGIS